VEPGQQVLKRIPTEEGKQKYIAMMHRVSRATGFMEKHGNVGAMIAIPFISLLLWSFFHKRKYNFSEHLAANMMFITFANIVFTVLVFPLQSLFKGTEFSHYFTYAALVLLAVYLGWCLNGFLQLVLAVQRAKSFLVSLLAIVLWFFLSLGTRAVYIYQSKEFYRFFERMFSH
jgi:hypothetical protein